MDDDFFSKLGISPESVGKFIANRDTYDVSKHVCICGHALNKHDGYDTGRGFCLTARHWCPCASPKAVLIVDDTRFFMRKTFGPGSKHALAAGLLRLRERGLKAKWIEPPACWEPRCESQNPLVFPVAVNDSLTVLDEPGRINALLCESCILKLKGVPGNEGKGWIW